MSLPSSRATIVAALALGLTATQCNILIGLDKFSDCTTNCTGGSGGTSSSTHAATTSTTGTGGSMVCKPDAVKTCPYMGPAGTEGIGDCKAGAATCAMDGSGYGLCMGEVDPTPEDCYKLGDENCDGIACSDPVIAALFGDASDQRATSMAVDKDGNILIAGYFQGAMTFGMSTITSMGDNDYFVAKFDSSGTPLWAKRYGDAANNGTILHVATDTQGDAILTGTLSGQLDFDVCGILSNTTGNPSPNLFVAKLSASGACQWAKSFGDTMGQGQSPSGVATNGMGEIILTGSFDSTIQFGATAPTLMVQTSGGYPEAFFAKLAADGSYVWSKKFTDPTGIAPMSGRSTTSPVTDALGNIYIVGNFTNKVALGTKTLTSLGSGGALFLAQFDSNGNAIWANSYGGQSGFSTVLALTLAGNSVIMTGNIADPVNFGGGPLNLQGQYDGFIATFDTTGAPQWSMRFGDPNDVGGTTVDTGSAVASDKDGNVLLTGTVYGQLNFPGGPMLTAQGGADVFLAKFDPTGKQLWSKLFGDSTNQYPAGVGADPTTKDVILAGSTQGSINFGTGNKTSAGGYDVFLATFQP